MKNYLARLTVAGILLAVGYRPIMQSNLLSFGSDTYEIQWSGTNGSKLFGSYGIISRSPSTPSRVEKVTTILPYKVKFSAQKNTLISAAGATVNQGIVEIKIFKNGSECGKVVVVGSAALANKICQ
ncbi:MULTISPECIES: hypothetical protein [unclassified Nostoc]|uniref:hypothetical protein n=1 Tax=unclassified Nostoc TaxID=2593658 RepID=UPI0015C3D846|nr:hypothetical protein [Nostoc sp. C052]QLE41680.1 hypothetical protein FD723_15490 [Nostoc sp. C052]